MKSVQQMLDEDMKRSLNTAVNKIFLDELKKYQAPDYYPKRKYGKWTIYKKDGSRVAWGLNEREMKAYMKLLEEK